MSVQGSFKIQKSDPGRRLRAFQLLPTSVQSDQVFKGRLASPVQGLQVEIKGEILNAQAILA